MRFRIAALAAALGLTATAALTSPAQAVSGTTLFATHPVIVSETTAAAKNIDDIGIQGDRLYLGYGDYNANTGPTDLAYVTTAGVTGSLLTAPTEEINVLRMIDGTIHAPWIDPTGSSGGYSNLAGNFRTFPALHIYDIARVGTSTFLAGSAADGAVIYRKVDGGAWTLSHNEVSPRGYTGWERFYWMGVINGKLYAQAAHKGYDGTPQTSGSEMFPMRVWNGSRWAKARGSLGLISVASDVEAYGGKLYTTRGVYDGRTVSALGTTFVPSDFYNAGNRLYAVSRDGQVAYTTGTGWTLLPGTAMPTGNTALSIAVLGNYVYVGTNNATVYRSTL